MLVSLFTRVIQSTFNWETFPSTSDYRPHRPPPPIPAALRSLSRPQQQPSSPFPATQHHNPFQPPSYEAALFNVSVDGNDGGDASQWTCNMCTFANHPYLNKCEQCDMPRVSGKITITASQFRPHRQHMQYQQASSDSSATSTNNTTNQTAPNSNSSNSMSALVQ